MSGSCGAGLLTDLKEGEGIPHNLHRLRRSRGIRVCRIWSCGVWIRGIWICGICGRVRVGGRVLRGLRLAGGLIRRLLTGVLHRVLGHIGEQVDAIALPLLGKGSGNGRAGIHRLLHSLEQHASAAHDDSCRLVIPPDFQNGIQLLGFSQKLCNELVVKYLALANPKDLGVSRRTCAAQFQEALVPQLLFGLHRPGGGGGRLCCGLRGRFGVIIIGDGLHLFNICQLVLCILQAQLGLLNVQFLPVQGELGQGGVIGQKDRALLHLLPLLHIYLSHLLGG